MFGQFAHIARCCFVQSLERRIHYNDDPRDIEWILGHAFAAYEKDGISIAMIDRLERDLSARAQKD